MASAILDEYEGTGTGTSPANATFRIKALNAPCNVCVKAFER
jgi:hypothetical protein